MQTILCWVDWERTQSPTQQLGTTKEVWINNKYENVPDITTCSGSSENHHRWSPWSRYFNLYFNHNLPIFTDGCKSPEGVGSGVFVFHANGTSELKFKLGPYCSVFQAELQAIQEGINFLLGSPESHSMVHLSSDSQASLLALQDPFNYNHICHQILSGLGGLLDRGCSVLLQGEGTCRRPGRCCCQSGSDE